MDDREADRIIDAILRGDRATFEVALDSAQGAATDLVDVHERFFAPLLIRVGARWEGNDLTVADEHLLTHFFMDAIHEVKARAPRGEQRPARERRRAVIACADGELHEVGGRMLADALDERGWSVSFLGASVPPRSLRSFVEKMRPEAVLVSASTALRLEAIRQVVDDLRTMDPGPIIVLGGRAFLFEPALALRLGSYIPIGPLKSMLDQLDALVPSPRARDAIKAG